MSEQNNAKQEPYFIVWDLEPQPNERGLIEFSFTIGSKPICNQNYINLVLGRDIDGEIIVRKWSK